MTEDIEHYLSNIEILEHDEDIEQSFFLNVSGHSIPEFLEWSRRHEGFSYRALANLGGLEFVGAAENAFKEIGVQDLDLASCVDGNPTVIRCVCRTILQHIHDTDALVETGETHLISRRLKISTATLYQFVLASLDGMERYHRYQPVPELHFLLKILLVPGPTALEKARLSKELKIKAAYAAALSYDGNGSIPSYRSLAKLLQVAPSSISRAFEDRDAFELKVISTWDSFIRSRKPD